MEKDSAIKIHILHTGKVCVSPGLPFRDTIRNPNPVQLSVLTHYGRKERIWIPVSCYLIEHPKGLILFDTGWSREMSPKGVADKKAQIKHLGLHYFLNQGLVPEGKAVDEQLSDMGISASDLDYVILSHMHSDHASGLKLVKDAKKILLSEEEYSDIHKYAVRYSAGQWKGVKLETFSFEKTGVGPVGKSLDFFGDGSVELINIPGHTNGLTAMKVNHNGKYVLLFADGGYAEKSWKELIPPGTALDTDMAMKSLQWIHDMSLSEDCIESLANHDSAVKPHVITLD